MTARRADAMRVSPSRSRRGVRWVVGSIAAFVVLLLAAGFLIGRSFSSGPTAANLATLRDFPLTLSDGRQSTMGSLVKPGLPTIVSLWASWCGPCQKEAPVLVDLRRRFGPEKLNFVYLNVREPGARREDLTTFVERVGIGPKDYAIADDANLQKLTNDAQNLIPRTYVFDRAGEPRAMIVGYKPLALDRVEGLLQ